MTRESALQSLREYRDQINEVDQHLVKLLNQRTRIVEKIGRVKSTAKMPIYEPKREDEVFANVTGHNGGPLTAEAVRRIFERIIDEMRTVQRTYMEKSDGDPAC